MEIFSKAAITALVCCIFALTIKKTVPEISFGVQVTGAILIALVVVRIFSPIYDFLKEAAAALDTSRLYLAPVLKASLIGVLSGICGSLCKDAGQGGLASVLQVLGCVCAIYTALPLLELFLHTLGDLL